MPEVSLLSRKLSTPAYVLWQFDHAPTISQSVLLNDDQQCSDAFPNRRRFSDPLQSSVIKQMAVHEVEDVHDIRKANVIVPVHSLQGGDEDSVFRDRYRKRVLLVRDLGTTRKNSRGQGRMLSGLAETTNMDFHQLWEAGNAKIKLVGQSVSPAWGLPDRVKSILENVAYFPTFRAYQ